MRGSRRRLSILISMSLLWAAMPAGAADGTFSDDDGNVHERSIEAIAAEGITQGCNPPANTHYCPHDTVTRGEMAAFLSRAIGLPAPLKDHFGDDRSSVFEGAINRIADTGITKGCNPPDNDEFCPTRTLTRGEMAAFLARALEIPSSSSNRFEDDNGHLFEGAINRIADAGITVGCNPPDNDRFCPDDPMKRDQMATFLTRALGLKPITPEPGTGSDGHIDIGPSELLEGSSGWSSILLQTYDAPRDPALGPFPGIGTFRVFCHFSHQNFDDAIVFPGEPGESHLHTYFGNTETNASSTPASLRNGGNSTCQGGIADRSAYWIPSVYDMATSQLVRPSLAAMYYQSGFFGSVDPASIRPIPNGLMMIAGDHSATPSNNNSGFQGGYWGCFGGGGAPTNTGATIPDCTAEQQVSMIISFPQCWDGVNLDSPDHKSHMAYPSFFSGCPASHPVAIPRIMVDVLFPVEAHGTGDWRLVSDDYAMSEPGGASIHADFVNGWNTTIMGRWLNSCIRAVKDCERGELGGGEALQFNFFAP